jgi:hypothetical protein
VNGEIGIARNEPGHAEAWTPGGEGIYVPGTMVVPAGGDTREIALFGSCSPNPDFVPFRVISRAILRLPFISCRLPVMTGQGQVKAGQGSQKAKQHVGLKTVMGFRSKESSQVKPSQGKGNQITSHQCVTRTDQ